MLPLGSFLLDAIGDWLRLFAAPLENLEMLWIIIPVWGVWVFSEFFQEKKGTSFGNAISNGATMLFVGVDWVRYLIRELASKDMELNGATAVLITVAALMLVYGLLIIVLGIKTNHFVKLIGRVRETTYFMVVFSPIIYGVEVLSFHTAGVIVVFFPVFYFLVELVDRLLPTPKTFEEETNALGTDDGMKMAGAGLNSDFGTDIFGAQRGMPQQPQWPMQQQPYQQWQRQSPQPRQKF